MFAKEQGFKHHRVTPAHAQANGEVERFMAVLNKTEQIAKLEGKDYKSCIYDTLTALVMGRRDECRRHRRRAQSATRIDSNFWSIENRKITYHIPDKQLKLSQKHKCGDFMWLNTVMSSCV